MTEFIQGIEVLNVTEIMGSPVWTLVCAIVGILGSFISGLTLCSFYTIYKNFGRLINVLITCIFLLIAMIGIVAGASTYIPTGKYEYQVTIDDTVPVTYLYENFEVISQEGKIWTIKEKAE